MIQLSTNGRNGWKLTPLGDLCEINPSKPNGFQRDAERLTTFIPMEAVDEKTGTVVSPQLRPYREVARGYTYFAEGDVIFAKITPCMQNGKTTVVTGLTDGVGFGSTEFHVLRAKPGVDSRWIYYLLRSAEFRRKAEENFEGSAGQRRVSEHFLKSVRVPFCDENSNDDLMQYLDARMGKFYCMRAAADRQLEASTKLSHSLLKELFPFPTAKSVPEGWTTKPLHELRKSIEYGLSLPSIKNGNGPKFVRITDIQRGVVNWQTVPYCLCSEQDSISARLEDGDILFARTGATTGKSFLIQNPPKAVFASYLIRVQCQSDRVLPDYLYTVFQSKIYWDQINQGARGGAQAGFNATMLGNLLIPLPPTKNDQARIASEFRRLGANAMKIQNACEQQQEALSALPYATLREFFNLGNGVHA